MRTNFVPGIDVVRHYDRKWLGRDIAAGLILTALLVPQGMAYAELAGLPAITGLYTSVMCLLAYAVFGPSRVLVLGPDSSLGPMIAAIITPLLVLHDDPARAIALASMLSIMVGVIMLVAGFARLGFIADLLSKPTQIGYLNGLALTIFVSQLPKLFGFSVNSDSLVGDIRGFVSGLADGLTNWYALTIGAASLVIIWGCQRWARRVPGVLVAVILGAIAVNLFDLATKGVTTIGKLPRGFPPFTVPHVQSSDLMPLAVGAAAIALVALADTMSQATVFAARRGDRVNGNQEMVGIGAANVATGLFQGFAVSSSASRTAVAEQAQAKSQLTSVVGALAITVVLLFASGIMRNVPQSCLAAIVIVAAVALVDIAAMKRLWRERRSEFYLASAALIGVAFFGVLTGIVIAVTLSILNVFRHAWWPYQTELGKVPDLPGLHDVTTHDAAKTLPGLVIVRFDAPLIFANSRTFDERIRDIATTTADLKWIVIASEPLTDIDTTAAGMLAELDAHLERHGISLVFAEMKDPVREKIRKYDISHQLDKTDFYPTVDAAADAYRRAYNVEWQQRQSE